MAFKPDICIKYEYDASTIEIEDNTGTDSEGYGGVNPSRNSFASILIVYYHPFDKEKELLNNITESVKYDNTYADTEKSKYVIPYHKDGWYSFHYYLIPTSVTTPEQDDIIYSTANSKLLQYDNLLNLVDVYDYTKLFDKTKYYFDTDEEFPLLKLKIKRNKLIKQYLDCKDQMDCGCDEEFKRALDIRESISSAINLFKIAPSEAQKQVEKMTKLFNNV